MYRPLNNPQHYRKLDQPMRATYITFYVPEGLLKTFMYVIIFNNIMPTRLDFLPQATELQV